MKIRPAKKRLIHSALAVSTFCLLGSPVLVASALTYQSNVGVSFTFDSSINLSLSSANLVISDLTPGNSSDSNIITVKVSTNNANGYTLNSSVGSDTLKNPNNAIYNTRKLIHTSYTSSDNSAIAADTGTKPTFSSVDYGSSLASLTSDDTWGYSFSTDTGTTWSNYSGLPLYSDTEHVAKLKETTAPSAETGDDVEFKIAAKASSIQASGEYNNVINFTVVGTPDPMTLATSYAAAGATKYNGYYKLQDMTSTICSNAEVVDDELQVIDTRDDKVYWIAKLADGHCWMTQNLDLDLSSSKTLTHADTDLGWGSDTATTSWTPTRSTIPTSNISSTGSISGWTNDDNTPYSIDTGDYYYAGYDGTNLLPSSTTNYLSIAPDANGDIINSSNSEVYFSTDPSRVNGGTHEHVGNYYNWSAAVASNDTSTYVDSTYSNIAGNPQNSICPAGWRLPTVTSAAPTYTNVGSKNEFARLANLYANYVGSASISSAGLEASPLFFARGGRVRSSSLNYSGNNADYWSSSVFSSSGAYDLYFYAASVYPQSYSNRNDGFSVRCLAR